MFVHSLHGVIFGVSTDSGCAFFVDPYFLNNNINKYHSLNIIDKTSVKFQMKLLLEKKY